MDLAEPGGLLEVLIWGCISMSELKDARFWRNGKLYQDAWTDNSLRWFKKGIVQHLSWRLDPEKHEHQKVFCKGDEGEKETSIRVVRGRKGLLFRFLKHTILTKLKAKNVWVWLVEDMQGCDYMLIHYDDEIA